jgi:hypothetical protein
MQELTISKHINAPVTADFALASENDGTELTIHCSYTTNRLGRMAKGVTNSQFSKGLGGLAYALTEQSERLSAN